MRLSLIVANESLLDAERLIEISVPAPKVSLFAALFKLA